MRKWLIARAALVATRARSLSARARARLVVLSGRLRPRFQTLSAPLAGLAAATRRLRRQPHQAQQAAGQLPMERPDSGIGPLVRWTVLAIVIPTTAWFLTAGYLAWDRYQTVVEMQSTSQLMNFAVEGHAGIHQLQTERGLSAAWLAGNESFAGPRLSEARERTDGVIAELSGYLQRIPESSSARNMTRCLDNVGGLGEDLWGVRLAVDSRRFNVLEGIDRYSMFVEDLIRCLSLIEDSSAQGELTRSLRTLRSLAAYKDFAALERGYGTALLVDGEGNGRIEEQYRHYSAIQLPYLRRVLTGPLEQGGQLTARLRDDEMEARLVELRQRLQAGGADLPPVEVWFALTTDRLEQMRAAEEAQIRELLATVTTIESNARQDLRRVLTAFGTTAVLLPIFSLGIAAGIGRSLRRERRQNKRIHFLATRDPITGLYNRSRFEELAADAIVNAAERKTNAALILLDLQRFGDINHIWGESVGNQILREVAVRLRRLTGEQALVSRSYGDEFSVLYPQVKDGEEAQACASALLAAFDKPFDIGERHIRVHASGGGALFPRDAEDYGGLLVAAKLACDVAKDDGSNRFHFFVPDMFERFELDSLLEDGLDYAAERGELMLEYQPRIRLSDERLVAVEALIRWNHPELGRVPPDRFVTIAENNGAILDIGRWVLMEGCRQAQAWADQGIGPLRISINLSAVQFHQADVVSDVRNALDISGLPPELLELELTETAVMVDMDQSIAVLRELRQIGVTLSIDDFGTGYSSLGYLQRFPVQQLKLDIAFVRNLPHEDDAQAITNSVVSLASSLLLEVVAEGVENREQATFLRGAGCAEAQGYLYSRPLSAAALAQFAAKACGDKIA